MAIVIVIVMVIVGIVIVVIVVLKESGSTAKLEVIPQNEVPNVPFFLALSHS